MGITPAPAYDDNADWPSPAGPPSGARLASWGDRLEAAVIDFFVRLAIVAACIAAGALAYLTGDDSAGELGLFLGIALGYVLSSFVYAPLMMARTDGQTVGHRSANTRVVMSDGSRMTGGRGFVREALVKSIVIEGIGAFTFYILTIVNYLSPLWDDNNEALHDKMCRTRVVAAEAPAA